MAILNRKMKFEPFVKIFGGYVKYLLSADHVVMKDNKTLQESLSDTGWVDLNSFIKYRVKNGYCTVVVNCRGHMRITSNGNGDVLGVLPVGARPSLELGGSATSMDYGGYETQWWVNSNGTIKATYLKGGATLGNFSFVVVYPV